jgi:Mg2+-importing ATPase
MATAAHPVAHVDASVALPTGLTEAEAIRRREAFGPNEPAAEAQQAALLQLLRRFANPLVAILILASAASAVAGDVVNAGIILVIVALSVTIEFVQTHRAERAAVALKARVAATAVVLRDGRWQERLRAEVVVGDLVRLSAGDMVPADGRLLTEKDLHVNEAALTGESLPVEKTIGTPVAMGSSVVSGSGEAVVTAIGPDTAFGKIARSLARRPPPSEFERGIVRFGVFILKTVAFLVLFVFGVAAAKHQMTLQSLLFGVALAVGLTPEFLPMITTVTLTRGAIRMARQKVIVKNLAAIQNLGSIDVLCSDKTGTLTTGEMQLELHTDALGERSERPVLLAALNSYFETGIGDPVDSAVLRKARVDPIDSAVLRHSHPDLSGYVKLDEIPFDFERRRVSVVASRDDAPDAILVTKGAPEHVLAVCTSYEHEGDILHLDLHARTRIAAALGRLGEHGHRLLAVASARTAHRGAWSKTDEHDLTLAGFLGFVDPPREGASDVVAALRREGVHVKVLTGDADLVARAVCDRVGISTKHVLLGSEIDLMTDPALAHRAERASIFARVSPAQKTRIVGALRTRGHVVGFLGDGINDAPSLRAADVGVSVASAVDVAKDAADVILLESDLRVLLRGVLEGRHAFGNVMKYLLMGTSSNFGNMFSMAGASVFLPFLPMLPSQRLLSGDGRPCRGRAGSPASAPPWRTSPERNRARRTARRRNSLPHWARLEGNDGRVVRSAVREALGSRRREPRRASCRTRGFVGWARRDHDDCRRGARDVARPASGCDWDNRGPEPRLVRREHS